MDYVSSFSADCTQLNSYTLKIWIVIRRTCVLNCFEYIYKSYHFADIEMRQQIGCVPRTRGGGVVIVVGGGGGACGGGEWGWVGSSNIWLNANIISSRRWAGPLYRTLSILEQNNLASHGRILLLLSKWAIFFYLTLKCRLCFCSVLGFCEAWNPL